LQSLGFSTTASDYPIVDVTDDGIDNGTATPLHPDFCTLGITTTADRLAYNVDWTGDGPSGMDGHGNINASIVAGYNNRTGSPYEDSNGYNYGLGINPYGRVAGSKVFCDGGSWCLADDDYTALISQTFALGGRISSNSWGASTGGAYTTDDQAYDALVRDAQPGSGAYAGNQEMTIVFSAGNSGASGSNTTGSPGNAKNVVTVGAAENVRPGWTDGCSVGPTGADNAQDIIYFSSRGPTDDQRVKPDLVAPGTHIEGAASQATGYDGSGVCDQYMPAGQTLYAASLVYRHYQEQFGSAPSPAMIKANLVNATRYLTGTYASGNLPSNNQGYGETLLGLAFDNTPRTAIDQSRVFTDSGQVYELRGTVRDPAQPFRVTLAWTDAPGPTTGNSYVNNLDLAVAIGGQVYKGNVFSGATSITGGSADPRNNVESVFLPAGQSGLFTVYITATNIAGDGVPGNADPTDQDFALLIYNGMQQFGYLDGVVHDGTLGGGLEGATVQAVTDTATFAGTTSATGYYTLTVAPDTYSVSAWKYGYTLQTITHVVVLSETVATRYLTLTQTSLYSLTGCITDSATSAPLATNVSVLNPFGGVITQTTTPQATGCYAFSLYGGPYTVTAQARLHLPGTASVNLVGDAVQNFALTATTTDGILWGRVTSMTTGNPVGGATIQATPGLTSTSAGADGNYEMQLPAGLYTITVSAPLYSTVVETNVVVPQSNLVERNYALPTAHMTLLPPEGISVTLRLGQQVTRTLTISNSGAGGLEFQSQESRGGTAGGGPDPFGYTFLDSENPDGPAYTWVDITDGTPLALTDDAEANVALPFPFKFYGTASSNLQVGNNGGVLFDATSGDVPYSNLSLTTTAVSNIIAPYWDDLGGSAGNVFIKTVGAAPNRQFIVEWYNRPHYKSGGDVGAVTLEVILYEATNNIKFQYQDVVFGDPANPSWDLGGSATVGIRQSGNNYLQYSYNSPVLTNSTAICFRYPGSPSCDPVDIPWLSMSPISGTVGADDSLLATATFNAGAVTQTGVYSGVLRFYTNDPEAQPYTSYPVMMTVVPEPPAFTLDKVPSANRVEIGLPMSYSITVNNSGGPATGVVISDTLPGNTLFAWASDSGTRVGNTVMWSGLNVRDGASMTVAYGVTVTCVASGTQIVNDDYQVYASERLTPTVGLPVTVTAVASGPLAGFTFTAPALRNRPVAFTNLSQNATAFAWAFGDGAMSTLLQPTHTYTEAKPYTVALTASNLCAYNVYSQVLTVEDYAVALYPAAVSDHAMPGQVVTYSLWLTNTGTLTDTFTLSVGSHAWSTALSTNTVSALGPNLSVPIKVYVTAPTNARAGAQDVVSVAAVSSGDPRAPKVSALSIVTSTADAVYGVTLDPAAAAQPGLPGAAVAYTLHVVNTGNAPDSFAVTFASANGWATDAPTRTGLLAAGAGTDVQIVVHVPLSAAGGVTDTVGVTVASWNDPTESTTSTLTTMAGNVYGVTLTPPAASQSNQPGATVTYTLRVTNTGNAASTFVFTNTGNTWDVHLPVTFTTLTASASRGVLIHVTIPSFTTLTKPSDVTTVTAVCQEDSQQSVYATLTTTAILYKVYVPIVSKGNTRE
jgi:uncharacterized repeat protein (TIGR01451 family)